jgi:chemotaxis protein MotC
MSLARQYMRRFQRSIYAEKFKERLAASAIQLGLTGTAEQFVRLEDLLNEWSVDERRQLYLSMAQSAVTKAMIAAGSRAAEQAAKLSVEGSSDAARAQLYAAASQIFTDDYVRGRAGLDGLNRSHLPKNDAELYDRVLSVATLLRKWTDAVDAKPAMDITLEDGRDHAHVSTALDTIHLAERAMTETDQLMQKGAP